MIHTSVLLQAPVQLHVMKCKGEGDTIGLKSWPGMVEQGSFVWRQNRIWHEISAYTLTLIADDFVLSSMYGTQPAVYLLFQCILCEMTQALILTLKARQLQVICMKTWNKHTQVEEDEVHKSGVMDWKGMYGAVFPESPSLS